MKRVLINLVTVIILFVGCSKNDDPILEDASLLPGGCRVESELSRIDASVETRLNQAFNARCGLPVFGWLREERMVQARGLLVNTDTSIAAIGDHLGFSSASTFAKAFRERFGLSPRALRKARHTPDPEGLAPDLAHLGPG